jgi:hypothetical protein
MKLTAAPCGCWDSRHRQQLSLAEERVEYFFQYLNSEVGVLSDHLYFGAFSILLHQVWNVIVKVRTHTSRAAVRDDRHTGLHRSRPAHGETYAVWVR